MRTTLNIEDDVLQAAKELAQREGLTAGQMISKLARRGLNTSNSTVAATALTERNGVPVFPPSGQIVTLKKIRKIMDAEGI